MRILNLSPGGFAANCYFVACGDTAVLIDATASPAAVERAQLESGAHLAAILCTHGHFDHLLTEKQLRDRFGVPLYLHENDALCPRDALKNASAVFGSPATFAPADRLLAGGETLCFGDLSLRVLHTPGHTAGSVVYLTENAAFTGDTLFESGFGRTDLYGGDFAALRRSLETLSKLPPDTEIYPGHGGMSTLAAALPGGKKNI